MSIVKYRESHYVTVLHLYDSHLHSFLISLSFALLSSYGSYSLPVHKTISLPFLLKLLHQTCL